MRFYLNIMPINYILYLVFKGHFHICINFYNPTGNYVATV